MCGRSAVSPLVGASLIPTCVPSPAAAPVAAAAGVMVSGLFAPAPLSLPPQPVSATSATNPSILVELTAHLQSAPEAAPGGRSAAASRFDRAACAGTSPRCS